MAALPYGGIGKMDAAACTGGIMERVEQSEELDEEKAEGKNVRTPQQAQAVSAQKQLEEMKARKRASMRNEQAMRIEDALQSFGLLADAAATLLPPSIRSAAYGGADATRALQSQQLAMAAQQQRPRDTLRMACPPLPAPYLDNDDESQPSMIADERKDEPVHRGRTEIEEPSQRIRLAGKKRGRSPSQNVKKRDKAPSQTVDRDDAVKSAPYRSKKRKTVASTLTVLDPLARYKVNVSFKRQTVAKERQRDISHLPPKRNSNPTTHLVIEVVPGLKYEVFAGKWSQAKRDADEERAAACQECLPAPIKLDKDGACSSNTCYNVPLAIPEILRPWDSTRGIAFQLTPRPMQYRAETLFHGYSCLHRIFCQVTFALAEHDGPLAAAPLNASLLIPPQLRQPEPELAGDLMRKAWAAHAQQLGLKVVSSVWRSSRGAGAPLPLAAAGSVSVPHTILPVATPAVLPSIAAG